MLQYTFKRSQSVSETLKHYVVKWYTKNTIQLKNSTAKIDYNIYSPYQLDIFSRCNKKTIKI